MKKKALSKKLQLSRETLRDLRQPALREAAGGSGRTCPVICGSDANTCVPSCLCNTELC
ncbi:MAG TPA: class I lanthipeptide [Thermoanaerobaculia bacterium]|nr:class I lanthipeptide [Thermoanaerobaculia bacterium]